MRENTDFGISRSQSQKRLKTDAKKRVDTRWMLSHLLWSVLV